MKVLENWLSCITSCSIMPRADASSGPPSSGLMGTGRGEEAIVQ